MNTRWNWHGGGLKAARGHFGDSGEPWLDLSTGINPHPWPGADATPIDWHRLPDEADLHALEHAAADYFGARAEHVCALPGTEIGLRLASAALAGEAAYVAPSYRTHGEMFSRGAPISAGDMKRNTGDLLIAANPNNPDGAVHDPGTLLNHLGLNHSGWLLIDEAFADANPQVSLANQVADERQLIVFRSFGKFFGLAGLRLGFVLGPQAIIARFRARLGAWPVSAAAIAIGVAAYRDHDWIAQMRERLPKDAAALDAMLMRRGYQPQGACPLFRLIETEDATALFERLARRAILTRPFDYNPRWLRIGLPQDDLALARLEAALADG